jgi:hypothetical protein
MKNTVLFITIRDIFLVFILIFQFSLLSAQVKVSDSLVKERIQCIQKMLDDGKKNANLWWNGWLIGYSALTVGQGAGIFLGNTESARIEWGFGSFTSLLGVVSLVLAPMPAGYAPDRLAQTPENNQEEEFKKLYYAEDLLKLSAQREKAGRSWKMHALCGVVDAGVELIYYYGFNQSLSSGIRDFAINTVISEAQILTQPTRAIKDYKNYCKKYKTGEFSEVYKAKPEWHLSAYPGGIVISMVF